MLDLEEQSPHLNISPAILSFYGPKVAILYAYLNYYVRENNIEITRPERFEPYYRFTLERHDIREITGMSVGEQFDAELDLCGAYLADSESNDWKDVTYTFYPQHEDGVRRWIYEKQGKWFPIRS